MSSFWLQFGSQIVTGFFSLLGAGAGVVGTIVVYKLNERTRRLDLYRQIYPEKFKTAQALMQAADDLYQWTSQHANTGDASDMTFKQKILDQATTVHVLSTTSEWLLGSEVKQSGIELVRMSRMMFTPLERGEDVRDWSSADKEKGGTGKYELLYQHLAAEVRKQLHMGVLDKLLPKG